MKHIIPYNVIIFSFIFFLSFSSCKKENIEVVPVIPEVSETPDTNAVDSSTVLTYLALGDSYTIGESVDIQDRYPIQLAAKLEADSILVDTRIIAQTGWRTDNLSNAIDNAALIDTFDLVSLLIGVNNQYQNRPIATYETEFAELLQTAIDLAGGQKENVFVFSIPDYSYTPFGDGTQGTVSAEIDAYNAINETITKDMNVSWFDITPISREGLSNPELVANDGLHPSGEMYRQWIDSFYPSIKEKL